MNTRVKICGITRVQDGLDAVRFGAHAIGLVFYAPSPRAVTPDQARAIVDALPPFVTAVGLFVNADAEAVRATLATVPLQLLQFHGDETPADCLASARPFIRAARVPPGPAGRGFDLLKYAQDYAPAQALLLDAHVEGYGGSGQSFDWTAFPWSHPRLNASSRLVLSGGLTPANVTDGIRLVRPWAVDVSSGVEVSKGIKCADKIQAFVAAVRAADLSLSSPS